MMKPSFPLFLRCSFLMVLSAFCATWYFPNTYADWLESKPLIYTKERDRLLTEYKITGGELDILGEEIKTGFTQDTINRYGLGAKAVPYARLSGAIYDDAESLGDDWKRTHDKRNPFSGFHGSVYVNEKLEPKEAVITFEGTNTDDLGQDYLTDLLGITLPTGQYNDASKYVKTMKSIYGKGYRVIVTGHSLGGGLAQAVGARYGLETYTFNSAAVARTTDLTSITLFKGNIDKTRLANITIKADIINPASQLFVFGKNYSDPIKFDFDTLNVFHLFDPHGIKRIIEHLQSVKRVYNDLIVPKILPALNNPVVPDGKSGEYKHGTFPFLGNKTHVGLDIEAPCKSKVYAFADGTVVDSINDKNDPDYDVLGYAIIIKHPEALLGKTFYTLYSRLKGPYYNNVGEHVIGGKTRLSGVGDKGASSGCHLHFEARNFQGRFNKARGEMHGSGYQSESERFKADWLDPGLLFSQYPNGLNHLRTENIKNFSGRELTLTEQSADIQALAFSPDGLMLAGAGGKDRAIITWDTETGTVINILSGHTDPVLSVDVSPDGELIASGSGGSRDYTVRLWNRQTGGLVRSIKTVGIPNDVIFSPDGSRLAFTGWDNIWIYNLHTKEEKNRFPWTSKHTSVNSLAFTPDGNSLISAHDEGFWKIWNISTRKLINTINTYSGKLLITPNQFNCLAVSDDGRYLVSGSRVISGYDLLKGKLLAPLWGHHDYTTSVVFIPKTSLFVAGGADGSVIIWDAETGAIIKSYRTGLDKINSLAISPDGKHLAIAGSEGVVKIWYDSLIVESAAAQEDKIASEPDRTDVLKERIEKLLAHIPADPEYLYNTLTTTQTIATVWMDLTSKVLSTEELRQKYDEFYSASIEYKYLYAMSLIQAKRTLESGDPNSSENNINEALHYLTMFNQSGTGSTHVFLGNIDSATILAQGIYDGSKAATKYGANIVLGPWASAAVDVVFKTTDFAVNLSDIGLKGAIKKTVADIIAGIILDQIHVKQLNGNTLSEFLTKKTTKAIGSSEIHKIFNKIVTSEEFKGALMSTLAKSTAHVVNKYSMEELTEQQVEWLIGSLERAI